MTKLSAIVRGWRMSALAATVAVRAATVGVSMVFAMTHGPTAFAPIALLLVMTPLTTMLATCGVDQQVFRRLVHSASLQVTMSSAVRAASVPVFMLPIVVVASIAVAYWFNYNILVFAVAGAAAALQSFALLIVASYLRAKTSGPLFLALFAAMALVPLSVRLLCLFGWNLAPVEAWVAGDVAAAAVSISALSVWLLYLRSKSGGISIEYRDLFSFGLPMTVHGLFQWVLGSSDRLVLGSLLGSNALGTYGAVYQFAGLFNVGASEINKTGLHRYAGGTRLARKKTVRGDRRLLTGLWIIGIFPVSVALIFLQNSGYESALALGLCLYCSFLPLIVYLPIANVVTISQGSARLMGAASGLGALANVLVNVAMAGVIGLYSGAVANIIGYCVMTSFLARVSRTRVKVSA